MANQMPAAPDKLSEPNIFREALTLLNTKAGQDMSEEESETLAVAMIPLMLLPQYSDTPIREGLEDLAKILEEAR